MVRKAFTHWTDAVHALIGFSCAVLSKVFCPLALAIVLDFVVYGAVADSTFSVNTCE